MKRRKGQGSDQPNLKRFRASVEEFASGAASSGNDNHEEQGVRKTDQMPRKAKRKEMRKLKKMRKAAYLQKKTLPTLDSLKKEKEDIRKAANDKRKKQKKRKKDRERKKKKVQEIVQEEDSRILGLREANKKEEKQIKQLEKQLKLNKRKSKNLPKSFAEDGLGYILDAVDSEKIKSLCEEESDLDDDLDLGSAFDSEGSENDAESVDGDENLEMSGSSDEEGGEEMEEGDEGKESNGSQAENVSDQEKSDTGNVSDEEESDMGNVSDKEESNMENVSDEEESDMENVSDKEESDMQNVSDEETVESDEDSGGKEEGSVDLEYSSIKVKQDITLSKSHNGKPEKLILGNNKSSNNAKMKTLVKGEAEDLERNPNKSAISIKREDTSRRESNSSDIDEDDVGDNHSNDEATKIDEDGDEVEDEDETSEAEEYQEDIYGRLRDKHGNIIPSGTQSGAYVPPGKRRGMMEGRSEKKKAELERLKKQLKGLVNRVSESNIQPISNQVEDLFCQHSRADMNEILSSLVLDLCTSNVLVPERLVLNLVMLVAILHGNVGSEVGAYFMQTIAVKFNALFEDGDRIGGSKEADNLLLILANLYNLKVTHSLLITDILRSLAKRFHEKDIELLLLLLKNVGFCLRKDDPVALKEIILKIQSQASSVDTSQFEDRSRVQFMLDILLAIKNNNMRKIPNYDPSHLDHMKKLLRNYVRGTADTQLRISLEDLLTAEEHGRWWIVGSAWSGKQDQQEEGPVKMDSSVLNNVSSHILELARKQRMNTEVRKNIFCIIMTSEDFIDAFEKLLQLGLKHQQEREIIHVTMNCCMQEKKYNAFYSYLMQKFCEYDRRFEMTVQFSLWDKFKVMSTLPQKAASNLSGMVVHLIATKAMSMSLFKVVEFSELDKSMVKFMKEVLIGLLMNYDESIVRDSFLRIAPFPKLHMLREGLKLFLDHFILRKAKKEFANKDDLELKISVAKRSLSTGESTLKL